MFLAIPAMTAAGGYEAITAADAINDGVGWIAPGTSTAVSFAIAHLSIAWLLRFVAHHKISAFIWYRLTLGAGLALRLVTGR